MYLTEEYALAIIRECPGALLSGHFVGAQGDQDGLGLHLDQYVQKDAITAMPHMLERLAMGIQDMLRNYRFDVVAAPPMGALVLGASVARLRRCGYSMLEKVDGKLAIKREPYSVRGKKVALVEDIITNGNTTREAVGLITRMGGEVVVISCIWSRGGQTPATLVPDTCGIGFEPLITQQLPSWARERCLVDGPCAQGVTIKRKPGHGAALERLVTAGQLSSEMPTYLKIGFE